MPQEKTRDEHRLPPGQTHSDQFPVLQYGDVPHVDLHQWRLRLWGEIEQENSLTWEEFQQLPTVERTLDLHCVTRWSKFDTHWCGVTMQTLFDEGIVTPLPGAHFVVQHAPGYATNLTLSQMMAENFLLATHYDGKPLTPEHGFPLRGITGAIPGRGDLKDVYLWKGAKWLNGLEFCANDKLGFWERYGYHNQGDVWQEQRFASS